MSKSDITFEVHKSAAGSQVMLVNSSGKTLVPALWLRTRSDEPTERDLGTRQRLFNPHYLPADLRLTQAEIQGTLLHVAFSDGAAFSLDTARLQAESRFSEDTPAPVPWTLSTWGNAANAPTYHWPALNDDAVFFKALADFIQFGFLIVHGAPTQKDSILDIASKFGFVRNTNFGMTFDVLSLPANSGFDSDDLAYRNVAIGPHTDNPYRSPVPGIQILHCLQNETSGGYSTLVDSLAVCAQLKKENPSGYELLTQVPVRYEYHGRTAQLVNICPIIELDGQGHMVGLYYSPRLSDIALMSEEKTQAFQAARLRLAQLFDDPHYEMRFKLAAGELMLFDNNRVLHGRTEFDPQEGMRHLQGCYIDRDTPRSHYRLLAKKLTGKAAS